MEGSSIRNVVCPTCNSTYRMPESRIPAKGGSATCKKCGTRITIEGLGRSGAPSQAPQPAPAKTPAAENPAEVTSLVDPALLADYPALQGMASPRLHYGEIFKPKKDGTYKSGLNKYKANLLSAVHGILGKLVREGEWVERVAGGTAYYPVEIFFGNGYLTVMYNRYAILATNQRLLLVNLDHRMKQPTHYLFQVPYHNLKKVSLGSLFGRIILKMKEGKKRTFTGIRRAAAKELAAFLRERKEAPGEGETVGKVMENLCPSCFVPQEKGLIACSKCKAGFKEPGKAMIRSLILPGLGDLYLGHRFLGIMEIIGSVLVWVVVILNLLAGNYAILILLVLYNGIDALLTHHMAKKGYMLAGKAG